MEPIWQLKSMPGDTCKILIVDDDEDIRANLADILSEVGYETVTASDGQVALDAIENECPQADQCFDICLLDFKMPGMDGVELLEHIQHQHPRIRTIMITAYAGADGVQRAKSAGTWKVLQKPIDVPELLSMIEKAISGQ